MARIRKRDGIKLAMAGLLQKDRPLLAHLVVTRYCNLDCAYCNEFDKVSKPVPFFELEQRIDRLAELGTLIVTLTGGEPLTHPRHADIIAAIRARGMVATTITNGFLLTREAIAAMNAAGLQGLQISIDGVKPDEITRKTLKSLRGKLKLLAQHAEFPVNINSVLGISEERTRDALEVAREARGHGFSHTVGVVHGDGGHLAPLSPTQRAVYEELLAEGKVAHRINHRLFQRRLIAGQPNDWQCRAGARYLYICEDGLVHYCSQQRGSPAVPLADYGLDEIRAAFDGPKACAPFCTVSCVHQASALDRWRRARIKPSPPPRAQSPASA